MKRLIVLTLVLALCGIAQARLLSYYSFNAGNLVADWGGTTATTPNGGVGFTTDAERGAVAQFDGLDGQYSPAPTNLVAYTSGGWIDASSSIARSTGGAINNSFTLSMWIKANPADKTSLPAAGNRQGLFTMFSGYNDFVARGGTGDQPYYDLRSYYAYGSK